jgi:hypothetical protein
MSIVVAGAGADHEPAHVAEALWSHDTDRTGFQIRLGID